MAIKDWSTTAASNNSAPPDGAPENTTLVSDTNNIMREIMAQTRSFYESPEWRDLGLGLEPTGPADGIVFTGDVSAYFAAGQKVKYTDAGGTTTANIESVSVSTNTTVTVDDTVTHAVSTVLVGLPNASLPTVLDGYTIGATTAGPGTFTTLEAETSLVINGSAAMTAIETTLAGSATKLVRADAIKTYIDAILQTGLGAALSVGSMEVYVSSAIAYGGAGGLAAQSHGLSGIPQELTAVAECTSADGTYSTGDVVPVPFPWSDDSGYRGVQLWATSTQVDGYVAAEGIRIMNKAASTLMTLTAAKWNIYIVAKYYT